MHLSKDYQNARFIRKTAHLKLIDLQPQNETSGAFLRGVSFCWPFVTALVEAFGNLSKVDRAEMA